MEVTVKINPQTRRLANWLRRHPSIRRTQKDLFHFALMALAKENGIDVPDVVLSRDIEPENRPESI